MVNEEIRRKLREQNLSEAVAGLEMQKSDISDRELYFLFELMKRRSNFTSTIFCTQYWK